MLQCLRKNTDFRRFNPEANLSTAIAMNEEHEKEFLNINNRLYQTRLSSKFKNRIKYEPVDPKKIMNFIPGTIIDILVKPGQEVKQGDVLLIIDAMKMQNRLKCHMDGKIKSVRVKKGDRVAKGTLLAELE
jgi:biotin carboxyl carrier protein